MALMNDIAARDETTSQVDLIWQERVDALIFGQCSEDEFMAELSSLRQSSADSAWGVLALLDQRYRRGQLPVELLRSIEAKIARRELGGLDYGTTVELDLVLAPTPVKHEPRLVDAAGPSIDRLAARTPQPRPAAAPAAASAAPPAVDRVLRNRYVLEQRLGSGGMGTVFKAQDRYRCDLPPASRIVAVKFLHEAASHPDNVSKLRREFYCAQALSHPNVVKVYELDRDDDAEFFTMEFLDGELLSSVIEKLAPAALSRPRAWTIIREVAAGLAHAHSRNVVHGDVKPQNIMICNSGETRILDFGASSAEIARKSVSTAMTPAYASCELLEGQGPDPRDDLYALACLSYELLTGRHPFQRRRSSVARDLGLIAERPPELSREQWRILQLGLAWRREERSMSVADWIERLHPAAGALRRTRLRWAAAIGAAAIGIAAAVIHERPSAPSAAVPPSVPSLAASAPADAADSPGPVAPDSHAPALAAESHAPFAAASGGVTAPVAAHAAAAAATPIPAAGRPAPAGPRAARAAPAKAANALSIAAPRYYIGARRNFAEIRVLRSAAAAADTSFAWWTEPGSASPGTDYVAAPRTIQLLSSRSQMASLFVKLVPNAARKHRAVFYVVIGEAGNGAALGRITRAEIVLPPQ